MLIHKMMVRRQHIIDVIVIVATCCGITDANGAFRAGSTSVEQAMQQSTVRLWCVNPNEGKATSSGSGFVVGNGNFVVSNWHVAGCVDNGDRLLLVLSYPIKSEADQIAAGIEWHSEDMDLALLKLARNSDKPSVVFATKDTVNVMDEVTVSGYPGAADQIADVSDQATVSLTRGVISRIVTKRPGTKLYQVDASINPGSSGGPLFNRFGQVIGINTYAALALVPSVKSNQQDGSVIVEPDRVHSAEGIGWAVQSDYLFSIFDQFHIPYQKVSSRPSHLQRLWDSDPAIVTILAVTMLTSLVAAGMALTSRGRTVMRKAVTEGLKYTTRAYKGSPQIPPQVEDTFRPTLKGVKGHFAGSIVELEPGALAIGRDPRICQLVLPSTSTYVSRQHCIVRCDVARKRVTLEDAGSENGTLLSDGKRIQSGKAIILKSGDRFSVGNSDEQFEIRMDGQ